jgi:hypothetical protein
LHSVQVVNQELPVYFVLRSSICQSNLEVSTTTLDYGNMYVNQQSALSISVKNTSMQPQKVAFVRLPPEISVSPNEGFAVLLPNESMVFDIKFCPLSAITYDIVLNLQSSLNDSYPLQVKAKAVESPIAFNCTTIQMRTTCPGERVVESIMATNSSKRQQCFEVVTPNAACSWLKVSPTIVDLAPGQSCRMELEYLPPADVMTLDPEQWRQSWATAAAAGAGPGMSGAGLPIADWVADSGWVCAKGSFGELTWVKAGAGSRPPVFTTEDDMSVGDEEAANGGAAEKPAPTEPPAEEVDLSLPEDISPEEWGILGKWNVPVFLKPRRPSSPVITGVDGSPPASAKNTARSAVQLPLFLNVQTIVTVPQLEIDLKYVDFGQMALGTRQIKVLKLRNVSTSKIHLHPDGLNAIGPFTVLNYSRPMQPGEFRNIIIECLPARPGLFIEVLELAPSLSLGGHRLRITLRTEGMKPSVSLEGLSPPPASWGPRDGILNFGNVLAGDVIINKFSVVNKSKFAVDLNITRLSCAGLSPVAQAPLIERTANGLPIFSYRPERLTVGPDSSTQIEVFFRPDRGRLLPMREDIRVRVGDTDEVLTVGLFGRCWGRQSYVVTSNPLDEPFLRNADTLPSAYVEDLLSSSIVGPIRAAAMEAQQSLDVMAPSQPPIVLEFPDPYAEGVDPSSYVDGDAPAGAGGKGAKPAGDKKGGGGGRTQKRKILVCSTKVIDNRLGNGNATFEILLSQQAKDSGLFTITPDKGAVNVGTEVSVEFSCTLPKPRGIGGLAVGSWENYDVTIVLKGGWVPPGETDEARIPINLKAFVSL